MESNLAQLKLGEAKKGQDISSNDLRRLVDEAHPPRAADMEELQGLQKTKKEREGMQFHMYHVFSGTPSDSLQSSILP